MSKGFRQEKIRLSISEKNFLFRESRQPLWRETKDTVRNSRSQSSASDQRSRVGGIREEYKYGPDSAY